jgi:predicted peroxiredoxin
MGMSVPAWESPQAEGSQAPLSAGKSAVAEAGTGFALVVDPFFKEIDMAEQGKELVVLITHGIDHELSSVGFTIANGGITSGMKVAIFLTSAGVDLVRKKATDTTHVEPLAPLTNLMRDFVARGGALYACTPCVKSRGYEQTDFVEGVTIAGASVILERLQRGAASLSF